jgi:hypothetical protein
MKILIKFPTRGRKNKFLNVLKKYYDMCEDKENTHFLITLDDDDFEMNDGDIKEILNRYENLTYFFGTSTSKIDAVNRDINKFEKEWSILLLASDDMVPQIKGYDNLIRLKMNEHFGDTDGVLWFNDGFQGNRLNTLCILGKKYYERFGYIYFPQYKSCFCDNEFMEVANVLGKQKYFEEVIIKHEHPDWGYGSNDHIHKRNVEDYPHDSNLYRVRKDNKFYL